jgi:ATP-dependent protease ClpP protease subunit
METLYDVLIVKDRIDDDAFGAITGKVEHRKSDILYLVLDTYGGAPDYGFRIMRLLDAKYKKIFILVPDKAMSTGTLMALGGDRIYMYHSSSLGPLDLQIEHPTDGSWISTLDVRDTMNTIISHTEIAARRIYNQTYNRFGLSKEAAAKIANEDAVKLLQPIVDKIDPYHLHKSFRGAEVGTKYGSILLSSRMFKDNPSLASFVSAKLANDYESHNYAITLSEAQKIFLNASDLGQLEEWNEKIRTIYEGARSGVKYQSVEKPQEEPAKTDAPIVKQIKKETKK